MRCARCNRPMLAAAAIVQTRDGSKGYGPKCAAAMGKFPAKSSVAVRRRKLVKTNIVHDDAQMDWVMVA